MISAPGGPGGNDRMSAEIARPGSCGDRRTAIILASEILTILAGQMFVLRLRGQGCDVVLARRHFLLPSRACFNASCSTVVAHIPGVVHHDRTVIDTGHVGDTDIGD